jgi:GntR family transcriptional regulator, transcriptional repressor for pyruvate dehydrogenase complex
LSDIFSRIEHSRTADEVVQQIESLILEGVLRTGDRLPGERELARRFEVSRPILRDALKALEGLGQLFTKPVTDLISMHRKAATDYLEYRREIEAVAAEYAARRATSDDLALLDRIMARMDEAHRTGNFDDEAEIDVEFHHAICECAHNIILLHTLRSCYRLLSEGVFQNRLLVFNVPGAREALLSQHRAIYAAVKAGDPAAARQAAMDHIAHVERAIAEAERSGDWQRVSRLRLMQRSEASDSEPARKRS